MSTTERRVYTGEEQKSTPKLTNEDFRKILMTPRRGDQTPSRFAHLDPNNSKFAQPTKDVEKEKRKKRYRKKKKDDDKKPKYRDRAAERRDGVNPDYSNIDEEILQATSSTASKPDIERNNFIGGDEEHTHLVKGLDYALLAKVKSDLSKRDQEEKEKEKNKVDKSKVAYQVHKVVTQDGRVAEAEEPIEFRSHLGRIVYNTIFRKEKPSTVDHFLPGRTTYVYELDHHDSRQEMPTIIKRSKDACPDASQFVVAQTHPEILGRIAKIMIYYTQGAKAYKKIKKNKKKEKELLEQELAKSKEALEKDLAMDMFDEDPSVPAPTVPIISVISSTVSVNVTTSNIAGAVAERKSEGMEVVAQQSAEGYGNATGGAYQQGALITEGQYFSQHSYFNTPAGQTAQTVETSIVKIQAPNVSEQEMRDKGSETIFRRDDGRLKQRKETDEREKDPSFISDSYAECYPGTYEGISYAAYDSDEEEDLTKMDSRKRLKRWDFETDDDWEKYEAQREAMPKAAFQFGVKMKDGRKSKKAKDAKLKRQLRQVEGIIEQKEGGSKLLGKEEKTPNENGGGGGFDEDPNSYASRLSQKRKAPEDPLQTSLDNPSSSSSSRHSKRSRLDVTTDPTSTPVKLKLDSSLFK